MSFTYCYKCTTEFFIQAFVNLNSNHVSISLPSTMIKVSCSVAWNCAKSAHNLYFKDCSWKLEGF